MTTVYIVGNGLFGRVASDMLTRAGIENIVYDNEEPKAGSLASGNITKPSWVSGLGDASRQAYKDLDDLYGLHKFSPEIALGKHVDLFYVPREKVIQKPHTKATVEVVGDGWLRVDGQPKFGPVLVAAGVWTSELVPTPAIQAITGVSFIFNKANHKPQFQLWAPYKQSISYSHDGQVWFGDGQAIRKENWNPSDRIDKALKHAKEQGLEDPIEIHTGYRPYVKDHKNGYFVQIYERTWISTGGGKNGIVLAAIQARAFLEEFIHDSKYSGH